MELRYYLVNRIGTGTDPVYPEGWTPADPEPPSDRYRPEIIDDLEVLTELDWAGASSIQEPNDPRRFIVAVLATPQTHQNLITLGYDEVEGE